MKITANKEELLKKAYEYLTTSKFIFTAPDGSTITYNPINSCTMKIPVNIMSNGILQGFINYLFGEKEIEQMVEDILKAINNEQNPEK